MDHSHADAILAILDQPQDISINICKEARRSNIYDKYSVRYLLDYLLDIWRWICNRALYHAWILSIEICHGNLRKERQSEGTITIKTRLEHLGILEWFKNIAIGLFTFASNAKESYINHIDAVNRAEKYIRTRTRITLTFSPNFQVPTLENSQVILQQ